MLGVFTSGDLEKSAELRSLYSRILELILSLSEPLHNTKPLSQACEGILSSLLSILSLVDFLDAVETLLQRPQDELRRKVLRLLDNRLRENPARDSKSRQKVLDFLAILLQFIKSSPDALLKHAAVACVDRIAETYGRVDPAKLEIAAVVIAGEACIGQPDDRTCVMGLLCLASLTEVLKQRIIPALPDALNRSLRLLEISLERGKEKTKLHDAVLYLLSAFFEHVPFMISDKYLDSILQLSFKSTSSSISTDSHDCRREMMALLARRVDAKESFGAIERNWSNAVQEGPMATKEAFNVVSLAIEKHPKSSTVNNVGVLSKLLHRAFDLRREQVCVETGTKYEPSELEDVENFINTVAIQMTYKLNDTIFRPLFVELVEWATNGLPKNDIPGKTMRLTTFYKFLQNFFGTLKARIRDLPIASWMKLTFILLEVHCY
jgi:U3 small nucleolar RNA-associated protein 10